MKLIDNARQAWRFWSVRVAAVFVAWGAVPEAQQAAILKLLHIDAGVVPAIAGLAFMVSRLLKQFEDMDQ